MTRVDDIAALEALYPGAVSKGAVQKVATRLTPKYRDWILGSRFCVLSTVGPEGTDGSPRGDDGPVVDALDENTLLMPDWRGNNRLDSLRNIVADGRVSLMFMVPGSSTIVRVNGRAHLSVEADLIGRFEQRGRQPATVIVIEVGEVYTQCAKAILRSGLWMRGDDTGLVPTTGEIMAEMTAGEVDPVEYEAERKARDPVTFW